MPTPIACGALGGFSGFFARAFREHDFVLGQRNCQWFLEKYLVLPADNKVLGLSGSHPTRVQAAQERAANGSLTPDLHQGLFRRIIDSRAPGPLHSKLNDQIVEPQWPRISSATLRELRNRAKTRFGRVFTRALKTSEIEWQLKGFLRIVWSGVPGVMSGVGRKLLDHVSKSVLMAFIERGQHEEFLSFKQDVRNALSFMLTLEDALEPKQIIDAMQAARTRGELMQSSPVPLESDLAGTLSKLEEAGIVKRPRFNIFGPAKYKFALDG